MYKIPRYFRFVMINVRVFVSVFRYEIHVSNMRKFMHRLLNYEIKFAKLYL